MWARRARRKGEWAAVLAASDILEVAAAQGRIVAGGACSRSYGRSRSGCERRRPVSQNASGREMARKHNLSTAGSEDREAANAKLSEWSWVKAFYGESGETSRRLGGRSCRVADIESSILRWEWSCCLARLQRMLLLRSGYHRRGENTLSSFFDEYCAEHYMALLNCHVAPWNWHQFFCDAVLTTFDRAPEKRQCVGPARTSHQ